MAKTTRSALLWACVALALASGLCAPDTSSMTPAQQAAWQVALKYADLQFSGQFPEMCATTMAGDGFVDAKFNEGMVPWAGRWEAPAGSPDCPALLKGLVPTWSAYSQWAIATHLEFHSVNADASAVYGTLTLNMAPTSTGNKLSNITVAHTLTMGTSATRTFSPVVTGITLVADSSAMAQSLCSSGKMVCQPFGRGGEAPRPAPVTDLSGVEPPVNGDAAHAEAVAKAQALMAGLSPSEQTNLANLQSYWGGIMHGSFPTAESFLSDSVVTQWHGSNPWVPTAGTWNGKSGWAAFLGGGLAHTSNFTLNNMEYQGCTGNTCVMTWNEWSVVKATGRMCDNFLNWALYTFNEANLIQRIDVLLDTSKYGHAFCGGFVTCAN